MPGKTIVDRDLHSTIVTAQGAYERSLKSNIQYIISKNIASGENVNDKSDRHHITSESKPQSQKIQFTSGLCQDVGSGKPFFRGNCNSLNSKACCEEIDINCESSISSSYMSESNNYKTKRSSEDDLRIFALGRPISSVFRNYQCPQTCAFGGTCKNEITINNILEELDSFWGDETIALTTTLRRHKSITKLLSAVLRSEKSNAISFGFAIGTSSAKSRLVCEATYLHAIGLKRTNMWSNSKKTVANLLKDGDFSKLKNGSNFVDDIVKAMRQTKDPNEKKSRNQTESCKLFIQWFAENNGSQSPHEGETDLTILPFETLAQLYLEYCFHCDKDEEPKAGKETFRTAYRDLKDDGLVRFTKGKGTFPTCDICNNANDLLANSKSMSPLVRDMIIKLKVISYFPTKTIYSNNMHL